MSKCQKWAAIFSFLSALSFTFGQATTSFTYAPLAGYFTGMLFVFLAAINAAKAFDNM